MVLSSHFALAYVMSCLHVAKRDVSIMRSLEFCFSSFFFHYLSCLRMDPFLSAISLKYLGAEGFGLELHLLIGDVDVHIVLQESADVA